jgi:hypothetical protein
METVLRGLDKLGRRIAKDMMGSIVDETLAITSYDWLPWMRVVAEDGFGFGPFFSLTLRILGNLWCGD